MRRVFSAVGGQGSHFLVGGLARRLQVADKPDNALWRTLAGVDLTVPIEPQGSFESRSGGYIIKSGDTLDTVFPAYVRWVRAQTGLAAVFGMSAEFGLFSRHCVADVTFLVRNPVDAYASWAKPLRHGPIIEHLGGKDAPKAIDYYLDRWRRAVREYELLELSGLRPRLIRYETAAEDARKLGFGWAFTGFDAGRGDGHLLAPSTRQHIEFAAAHEITLVEHAAHRTRRHRPTANLAAPASGGNTNMIDDRDVRRHLRPIEHGSTSARPASATATLTRSTTTERPGAADRVLVISSGDGTGVNFVRALRVAGNYHVVGIDTNLDDYHASEADDRYLLAAPGANAAFVEQVATIAQRHDCDLVYSADTGPALTLLSVYRDRIPTAMYLPDLADHLRMEDKWATWLRLRRAGLPVPTTMLATTPSAVVAFMRSHGDAWLRARTGSGGAGAMPCTTPALALAWLDEQNGWRNFTVAERLGRRTATFSGVFWNSQLVASQLRERAGWKYGASTPSGVTGVTGTQKTVDDPALHELAVAAIRAVADRPHGAIGVDFTYTENGQPLPTEVQPARFYSSMQFLAAAGINLPDVFVRLALHPEDRPTLAQNNDLLNPIRDAKFWVKSVDKLPRLLDAAEFDVQVFDGS